MRIGAAPSRLKRSLALTLALSLVVASPETAADIARAVEIAPAEGADAQAWRSFIGSYSSPAAVPFLQTFGLSTPDQVRSFISVMGHAGVSAQAVSALPAAQQSAAIGAAADRYARQLVGRTATLSAAPGGADPGALRSAQAEFTDIETLAALAPGRRPELERGRTLLESAARTALTNPIREAGASWNDKPATGAPTAAPRADGEPAAWRLQKAAESKLPRSDFLDAGVQVPASGSEIAAAAPHAAAPSLPEILARLEARGEDLLSRFATPAPAPTESPGVQRRAASADSGTGESEAALPSESGDALRTLGLTPAQFRDLVQAQIAFKRDLLADRPELKRSIFSARDQERFSKAVLSLTERLRLQGVQRPLAQALIFAAQSFYGDVLPPDSDWNRSHGKNNRLMHDFAAFIGRSDWEEYTSAKDVSARLLGIPVGKSPMEGRVARALLTSDPALFVEPPGADGPFMTVLRRQARDLGAALDVIYAHPFTEDSQLLGHDVPLADGRLAFGQGELTRQIALAQAESEKARREGRPARRALLLIKNVEALEPGVRTLLQSALADREITHPVLGRVPLPDNLQFLFTIRRGGNIEDDSFYDRVAVRTLPAPDDVRPPPGLAWPKNVDALNYMDSVGVSRKNGRAVLRLPGAEIPLSDDFAGITPQNFQDEIYLKTGLVLDYQTVRMLAMMAQVQAQGGPMLRLEGPTGLGKTFAARGYARLRGRPFLSNPVSDGTQLSDWIGGFEQDESGRFRFEGETPFKQRVEQGGVVALSELNTLLDQHEKASLGWWLTQIAETPTDAQGFRTIVLSEVPTPEGLPVPVLRIHPDTLIIIDTNPEGEYAARGALPDVLQENTPRLSLAPAVSDGFVDSVVERTEKNALRRQAEMFLKHDWISGGRALAPGVADAKRRERLAERLAAAYWSAARGLDRSGRILSTRELRRMAEDLLAALAAGRAEDRALADAAAVQLGGWLTNAPEIEMLRRVIAYTMKTEPHFRAQDALLDQLLVKGRPTHLRVPAEADAREALSELQESPGVELSLIHATEETDRFQMEGGLVPAEGGTGLTFGPGIFARMIERARAAPDKTIVYVFDNAHNIKPEQIVALNEFLQDGLLYPKGARQPLSMPANARVLFVSREDSALTWSPAERSRFVELAAGEDADWVQREVGRELGRSLAELPEAVASLVSRWARGLDARLRRAAPDAPAGALSRSAFRLFLKDVAAAVDDTLDAGIGTGALALRLEKAALDRLGAWASPARSAEVSGLVASGLSHAIDALLKIAAAVKEQNFAPTDGALIQAKSDFALAETAAERREALNRIDRQLDAAGAELSWRETPFASLRPLDVGRALQLLDEDFPQSRDARIVSSAMTPDAKTVVTSDDAGRNYLYRFDAPRKRYQWSRLVAQHTFISNMAISGDGLTLLTATKGEGRVYADFGVWRYDPAQETFVPSGIKSLSNDFEFASIALAPDGRTFAVNNGGTVRVYRVGEAGAARRLLRTVGRHLGIPDNGPSPRQIGPAVQLESRNFASDDNMAFSADGRTLAVCTASATQVLRLSSGQEKYAVAQTIPVVNGAFSVAMTPDGGTLAIGGSSGQAVVLRAQNGGSDFVPVGRPLETGAQEFVASIGLSADGKTVFALARSRILVSRLDEALGNYVPLGSLSYSDLKHLTVAEDGRTMLFRSIDGLRVAGVQPFLVKEDGSVVLLDGRELPRNQLIGPFEIPTASEAPREKTWREELPQVQADFAVAQTAEERAHALDSLRRMLEGPPAAPRPAVVPGIPFDDMKLIPNDLIRRRASAVTAISADGRTFAVADEGDVMIERWDLDRNEFVYVGHLQFSSRAAVLALAFSSDGDTLVLGSANKEARVYRFDPQKSDFVQAGAPLLHGDVVLSVGTSGDGDTFVTGSFDGKTRVYHREPDRNEFAQIGSDLDNGKGGALAVKVAEDGLSFFTFGSDGKIRSFRRGPGGAAYAQIGPAHAAGRTAAVTPDGRVFVASGPGRKLSAFRFDDARGEYVPLGPPLDNDEWITAIAVAADGRSFAVGSNAGSVRVFHLDSGSERFVQTGPALAHGGRVVSALALSHDGGDLFTAGDNGRVAYYRRAPGENRYQDRGSLLEPQGLNAIKSLELTPDDRTLLIAGGARSGVQVYSRQYFEAAAFSFVPTEAESSHLPWRETTADALRPLDVGRALALLSQHFGLLSVISAAMTPDGRTIVVSSIDRHLRVFRLDSHGDGYVPFGRPIGLPERIQFVALAPNGRVFVAGNRTGELFFFRLTKKDDEFVRTGSALTLEGGVNGLAVGSDGRTVVAQSGASQVHILRLNDTGTEYSRFGAPHELGEHSLAASSDGRILIRRGSDKMVHIQRLSADWTHYAPAGPALDLPESVVPLQTTPDGRVLALKMPHKNQALFLRLGDKGEYSQVGPPIELDDGIFSRSALSSDGGTFVAASEDGKVRLYRFDPKRDAYLPAGDVLDTGGEITALSLASGGLRLMIGGRGDLRVYAFKPFIVQDDESVVLTDGRVVARSELAGPIEAVEQPASLRAPPAPAAAAFRPRYGGKPFYFAADADGRVWLNFKGRWFATRHALVRPVAALGGARPVEKAFVAGRRRTLEGLEPSDLRDPYAEDSRPLSEDDFLLETAALERVEGLALDDWARGRAMNFVGSPGAGKTSIARELGLLLGLPRFVFQMHGERELADLLGAFREDPDGKLVLTSRAYTDAQGRRRFKLPLLDMIVNGGIFVLDEGAIGERGRELLNWFSGLASGDREIVLQEFPGAVQRLPVSKDFGLVITNNRPEDTPGRLQPKSEVTSNVHTIAVPDDDAPETLARLFSHFLGSRRGESPVMIGRWCMAVAALHHALKPAIGSELGKDNAERYYLSKREVRRVAGLMRAFLNEHTGENADEEFYWSLRTVYESMYTRPEERKFVADRISEAMAAAGVKTLPLESDSLKAFIAEVEEGFDALQRLESIRSLLNVKEHEFKLSKLYERLKNYADPSYSRDRNHREFPSAATNHEAWVEGLTKKLLSRGEPVLFIAEPGARTSEMARAATTALGARLEPVDAGPEQGELELLGGWLPYLGERAEGAPRSQQARGRLTRYMVTQAELEKFRREGRKAAPVVLWLRNVDQWSEDVRTALNGLLEDGYIDVEGADGRTVRLYKPPYLNFLAEMPSDSTREFSSAFFSRWVKIGVSQDSVEPNAAGGPSDFERVLRARGGLDALDAHRTAELREALSRFDAENRWSNRGAYRYTADIFFALADAVRQAREEDPRWSALLARVAAEDYDPRDDPWSRPRSHRALVDAYRGLSAEIFAREARRLVAARLPAEAPNGEIPDAQRFEEALKAVLGRAVPAASAALTTDDGTPDGRLAAAGGVPVRRTDRAEGLRSAELASRVFPSPQIERALALLARADRLGMATALTGETGAVKTSVCALWARLTGRTFYKYQAHGGSEVSDFTIDFTQEPSGEFRKRVKDFYRVLKEGNAVVDIDEANLAPWMLWTLEPLLRGERAIQPMFPEEPAFRVGDGVQIVMTFNPARYSGRQAIDPRLLDRMVPAWMEPASPEDLEKVVASFYGVIDPPAAAVHAAAASAPRRPPAQLEGRAPGSGVSADNLMRAGRETFDENAPAPRGPRPDAPPARGIFTPELYPYTRLSAYDVYDEATGRWRNSGELTASELPGLTSEQADALARELAPTHDVFAGRTEMTVGPRWQSLPAAGPDMRFLQLDAFDAAGKPTDPGLELARDSADNYYVRAAAAQNVELRYRVAVPADSFGRPVPQGLSFRYPAQIPEEVRQALTAIGLRGDESDYRTVLHALVAYFRDFSLKEDGIVRHGGSLYLDIVLSKCGVCRHRAFAFARTAAAIGIPARYVESEIHAWAEVYVPHRGWMRVDLGGGGDPMNMDLSPLAEERHSARGSDGLPTPDGYLENSRRMAERMRRAMESQGLKPSHADRGSDVDGDDAGSEGGGGAAADRERVRREIDALDRDFARDAQINDELAPLFASGKGDTQFVFDRMLRALRDAVRVEKLRVRSGLEIDPQALIQRRPKPFVRRKKREKMQTTAVSVLLDFSGSMKTVKSQLAYTVGAVGENFWKLREIAPENFFYDLSSFSEKPKTYVAMEERLDRPGNADRIVGMANDAGEQGGTNIVAALRVKLSDFLASRRAAGAKIKSLLLVTDGADLGAIVKGPDGQWAPTAQLSEVLGQYAEAGIDVTFIGIGPAADQVRALDGPRRHYVRIDAARSEDIAEAIAKLAELNGRGARLPDGELNGLMRIAPPTAQ